MKNYRKQHRFKASEHKKRRKEKETEQRSVPHPLYGDIPLIKVSYTRPDGKTSYYWEFDPDYKPVLPKGAIAGDVHKQVFCSGCWVPKYFYQDIERVCYQCNKPFVFTAREQKFWYETLAFNFNVTAVRCRPCRKQRRTDRFIRRNLEESINSVQKNPDEPIGHLALAEATIDFYQRFHQGNLDNAVAACRNAFRISPNLWEALFWEANCHAAAGRIDKAKDLFEKFIGDTKGKKRYKNLVKRARATLQSLHYD
ncbi:zinc-ribbon domain containing protein [candidate division KSB1 bacterium]|nr:zinc-ribbon domain containing protein [candidate division KSB1 bacterium]